MFDEGRVGVGEDGLDKSEDPDLEQHITCLAEIKPFGEGSRYA